MNRYAHRVIDGNARFCGAAAGADLVLAAFDVCADPARLWMEAPG